MQELIEAIVANPRVLVGAALAAAGAGAVVHRQIMLARVAQSQRWPSTTGRILEGQLAIHRVGAEITGGVRASEIRYTYQVDGRRYESDVVCLGGQLDTSGGGPAEERLARYPIGEEVAVFYNPSDPAQACLEREAEGAALTYGVAAVFIVIGALVAAGKLGSTPE